MLLKRCKSTWRVLNFSSTLRFTTECSFTPFLEFGERNSKLCSFAFSISNTGRFDENKHSVLKFHGAEFWRVFGGWRLWTNFCFTLNSCYFLRRNRPFPRRTRRRPLSRESTTPSLTKSVASWVLFVIWYFVYNFLFCQHCYHPL